MEQLSPTTTTRKHLLFRSHVFSFEADVVGCSLLLSLMTTSLGVQTVSAYVLTLLPAD